MCFLVLLQTGGCYALCEDNSILPAEQRVNMGVSVLFAKNVYAPPDLFMFLNIAQTYMFCAVF